jgi:hypothetical protein
MLCAISSGKCRSSRRALSFTQIENIPKDGGDPPVDGDKFGDIYRKF